MEADTQTRVKKEKFDDNCSSKPFFSSSCCWLVINLSIQIQMSHLRNKLKLILWSFRSWRELSDCSKKVFIIVTNEPGFGERNNRNCIIWAPNWLDNSDNKLFELNERLITAFNGKFLYQALPASIQLLTKWLKFNKNDDFFRFSILNRNLFEEISCNGLECRKLLNPFIPSGFFNFLDPPPSPLMDVMDAALYTSTGFGCSYYDFDLQKYCLTESLPVA